MTSSLPVTFLRRRFVHAAAILLIGCLTGWLLPATECLAVITANAWHIPDNSTDLAGTNMRSPEFDFNQSTQITFFTGVQKFNNGFGTANQTGGFLYIKKASDAAYTAVALQYHADNGNNQYWKGFYTLSAANFYGANDVVQYYFALTFNTDNGNAADVATTYIYGGNGDAGGPSATGTSDSESVAQATPFSLRNRPAFVFHDNNRVVTGQNVQFWSKVGYVGKDRTTASQWVTNGAVYYTTDGSDPAPGTTPGSADANSTTIAVPVAIDHYDVDASPAGDAMWWMGSASGVPMNTVIRYKSGFWNAANNEQKFADYRAPSDARAGHIFSFSIGAVGDPILTVNGTSANYTTTHVFINEVYGEQSLLTVFYDPATPNVDPATVQVFTNLNRRDYASLTYTDASGIATEEGIEPPSGDLVGPDDSHYYKAYAMSPAAGGGYTVTLPASKTGAYRLTARYKLAQSGLALTAPNGTRRVVRSLNAVAGAAALNTNPWVYYTTSGRRDHAVVVSPAPARDIRLYEINTLNIDAASDQPSQRSTFPDLSDINQRWNLAYLQNLGCNWLWFQPIHPNGIDGRQTDPSTGHPYNVGSPYAVKNFFEIMPLMGKGFSASTDPNANDPSPIAPGADGYALSPRGKAKQDFANFVAAADAASVGVMLDAPFNHTSYDTEMGNNGINLFSPFSAGTYVSQMRNTEARFFSQSGNYAQRASGAGNIAVAPDRGDFGKFGDTYDIFFGTYSALVDVNPADNGNYLNEGDQFFGYLGSGAYPNGDPNWNSIDFNAGGVNNNITRNVWHYFAQYVPYWLGHTGHGDANGNPSGNSSNPDPVQRLAEDNKGIDGLRADFGQGLPPQCWEYIINVARSYKWDFVFMTESLDGGAVTYRSNRHFDILNENIVFPFQAASVAQDYRNIFDQRRQAYGQSLVLMNSTSHDEANYADPYQALIRYMVSGTIDGVPMIFYGQENGISTTFGFDHYETNFGKQIPHFKEFNSLAPVLKLANRTYALDQLYPVFSAVGQARQFSPALRSSNRYYLNQTDGNSQAKIFSIAKYAAANAPPGVSDVVFGFVNLDRDNDQQGNFNVNITQNGSNLFGIARGRSYNVKNIAAYLGVNGARRDNYLIEGNATGDSLLDNGLFAALKRVPTTDGAWATAPFEAQYLKVYDVTPPPTDAAPGAPKGYGLGNSVTFTWPAVVDAQGGVSGYRLIISTDAAGNNVLFNGLVGNVTSYTLSTATPGQTLYARVAAINNAGVEAAASALSAAIQVLDPNGDADGDGMTNAAEDFAGTNPFDRTSVLHVLSLARNVTTNKWEIGWSSVAGKNYQVEYSADLSPASFAPVSGTLNATGTTDTFSYEASSTRGFFRVRVVP